ncbi:hypothetical protein [Polaribacter aquimarinus]|nr:hypothetical protein [Polaribacter aquimarinus]
MFLILISFNCESTKKNISETQNWINSQNFTVIKPQNWRAIKHHGYVGYTPFKKGDNFFNNLVSIFQFKLKEKPKFEEFVEDQIKLFEKTLNISSQEILTEKNDFGNIYILNSETTWNGKEYKQKTIYIEHKGEYYYYNYSSLKEYYTKYYDDAISIFQSIKFKL